MTSWQQVAIGVFVGLLLWRAFSVLAGSILALAAQRSRTLRGLIAEEQRRERKFSRAVNADLSRRS